MAVAEVMLKPHTPRQSTRRRVRMTLEMQSVEASLVLGRLFDITNEGFMLLGKAPMTANQRYELVLPLSELIAGNNQIRLTADCRWSQPSNLVGFHGAGFEVVNVEPIYQNAWAQLIQEF